MLSVSSSTHALKAGSHVILQSLIVTCHKRVKYIQDEWEVSVFNFSIYVRRKSLWIAGSEIVCSKLSYKIYLESDGVEFGWKVWKSSCLVKVVPQRLKQESIPVGCVPTMAVACTLGGGLGYPTPHTLPLWKGPGTRDTLSLEGTWY